MKFGDTIAKLIKNKLILTMQMFKMWQTFRLRCNLLQSLMRETYSFIGNENTHGILTFSLVCIFIFRFSFLFLSLASASEVQAQLFQERAPTVIYFVSGFQVCEVGVRFYVDPFQNESSPVPTFFV